MSPFDTYRKLHEDPSSGFGVDTVTLDVPLLIRIMEVCREEIKDDKEIHQFATQIVALKDRGVLGIKDWDDMCTCSKKKDTQESVDESWSPGQIAPKGHHIEAHGTKGMKGTPWHKTFRNHEHLHSWSQEQGADVHGARELEDREKHPDSRSGKNESVSTSADLIAEGEEGASKETHHFTVTTDHPKGLGWRRSGAKQLVHTRQGVDHAREMIKKHYESQGHTNVRATHVKTTPYAEPSKPKSSPEKLMKAREKHWHKTGVSHATTNWMKARGML